jgi:mono/diheme cytochrome c family protein
LRGCAVLIVALLLAPAAAADDGGAPARDAGAALPPRASANAAPGPSAEPALWAPAVAARLPAFVPARGRALYDRYCRACHGRSGRGNGPTAASLVIQPRDLTLGTFKVRSTPSGSVASDFDLFATISFGLGAVMPGWGGLPEVDRWQLVHMVKSFSPRFKSEPAQRVLAVPPAAGGDAGRGRVLYHDRGCVACHGEDGRGAGAAAHGLRDERGRPMAMPNLRRGETFRAGCAPEALQKTLFTGLDGTPMPAYAGTLSTAEARDLVAFLRSLLARPDDCR